MEGTWPSWALVGASGACLLVWLLARNPENLGYDEMPLPNEMHTGSALAKDEWNA